MKIRRLDKARDKPEWSRLRGHSTNRLVGKPPPIEINDLADRAHWGRTTCLSTTCDSRLVSLVGSSWFESVRRVNSKSQLYESDRRIRPNQNNESDRLAESSLDVHLDDVVRDRAYELQIAIERKTIRLVWRISLLINDVRELLLFRSALFRNKIDGRRCELPFLQWRSGRTIFELINYWPKSQVNLQVQMIIIIWLLTTLTWLVIYKSKVFRCSKRLIFELILS